jgi:uncharacterized membrane protein
VAFFGQVQGTSPSGGTTWSHAVLWPGPSLAAVDLGTLGGTSASANDDNGLGVIVGSSMRSGGDKTGAATRWSPPGYAGVDLNTKVLTNGWTLTGAANIDASGRVVGMMQKSTKTGTSVSAFALIPLAQ